MSRVRARPAPPTDKSGPRCFTRVTAAELEDWQQKASAMRLHDLALAVFTWRPRAMRVQAAGAGDPAAVWLELHGPDGWVQVGSRLRAPAPEGTD